MAISQSQATGPFSQHGSNFVVLDARRSQKQVRNNSRPKDTSMQAKAVKGLSDAVILARGGYATKATALGGTGKVADRHRHTVQDGYSGIVEWQGVIDQTKTCDHAIIQAHDVPPQPFRFCLAEDSRPHGPFLLQDQLAHRVS